MVSNTFDSRPFSSDIEVVGIFTAGFCPAETTLPLEVTNSVLSIPLVEIEVVGMRVAPTGFKTLAEALVTPPMLLKLVEPRVFKAVIPPPRLLRA